MHLVLEKGTVFARMAPEHKKALVEALGSGQVDELGRANAVSSLAAAPDSASHPLLWPQHLLLPPRCCRERTTT